MAITKSLRRPRLPTNHQPTGRQRQPPGAKGSHRAPKAAKSLPPGARGSQPMHLAKCGVLMPAVQVATDLTGSVMDGGARLERVPSYEVTSPHHPTGAKRQPKTTTGAKGSHRRQKAAKNHHRRQRQPNPPPAPKAATDRLLRVEFGWACILFRVEFQQASAAGPAPLFRREGRPPGAVRSACAKKRAVGAPHAPPPACRLWPQCATLAH